MREAPPLSTDYLLLPALCPIQHLHHGRETLDTRHTQLLEADDEVRNARIGELLERLGDFFGCPDDRLLIRPRRLARAEDADGGEGGQFERRRVPPDGRARL